MKIDRLLSIVIHLLNRETVTAKELSEKFGVSVRTILRDIDAIGNAGIPLYSLQGAKGGFGIVKTYKIDKQLVNTDDLSIILKSLKSMGSVINTKSADSAFEKLSCLVPDSHDKKLKSESENLILDFSFLNYKKFNEEYFNRIQEAVSGCRLIGFDYIDSRQNIEKRVVEPMSIVFKWGSWYLCAFCRLREDFRIFKLSRIRNLSIDFKTFNRRSFNAEMFFKSNENYREKENRINLKLRFSPEFRFKAEECFGLENSKTCEDGSSVVTLEYPEDSWVYGMILSFGGHVEVLEPPHLRKIIYEESIKMQNIYKKDF